MALLLSLPVLVAVPMQFSLEIPRFWTECLLLQICYFFLFCFFYFGVWSGDFSDNML